MTIIKVTKSVKYLISMMVLVSFAFQMLVTASYGYSEINDNVSNDHWVSKAVASLVFDGLVHGDEFTIAKFDTPISRGAFTDLFMRLFPDQDEEPSVMYASTQSEQAGFSQAFTDVTMESEYYVATAKALKRQIVMGYPDGSFRPQDHIQRQDVFTIIGRSFERGVIAYAADTISAMEHYAFSDEGLIDSYAKGYVYDLASKSIIIGYEDGSIRPFSSITYAETLALIERIRKSMIINNTNL